MIPDTLRRVLVRFRDHLDHMMHATRGRRARNRLAEAGARSVLFICHGNVCRSPYGEWYLKARAKGPLQVESAGFIGPGRAPPSEAQTVALARGVDHRDHRSRVVTPEMLDVADAVFVFDRFNVKLLREVNGVRWRRVFWLGDLDPEWAGKRAIADPWGRPRAEFEEVFERIERCVDAALDCAPLNGQAAD